MAKGQETVKSKVSPIWMAGALVLMAYVPLFLWMWDRWFDRDSYYSHGVLIPFVSAYLIWKKRGVLKKISPETSLWGLRLFFVGIVIYLFSALLRVYFSSGLSLIIVLCGLTLHFYGRKVFKELLFPILFLIFMVPMPLVVITDLSFNLKIFAAQIAVAALNGMGLFCVQHGSIIVMRHAYVIVGDVCSGLRSLITLMALGSLFAYGMRSSFKKKTVLFLSTIPIAVITNVARIIFTAYVCEKWGTRYATGTIHEVSGLIVFVGAFCLLYAVQKMIE